jgi:Mrp family chromosome partitioning ATPase
MSENCSNSCSSCGESCSERREQQVDFRVKPNEHSKIKKVIGIVSGKGGVGKSLVTSMLAVAMRRKGYNTAILDADITGPSIPKTFGIDKKAVATEKGIMPIKSETGINIMSINLLLREETDPVIWRGPVVGNIVKQFWSDVIWGDVDFMFIDMPPGTGDVPLTVFQSLNVDGIIIVTSPQDLVSMIVTKAVKMAEMMKIPIIGLVENMSYFKCPGCEKEYKIFGESNIEKIAQEYNLEVLGKIPIDPAITENVDKGKVEDIEGDYLGSAAQVIEKLKD